MDKNLAAFLDPAAFTVSVVYQGRPAEVEENAYKYVCNIEGVKVGDLVIVPTSNKAYGNNSRPIRHLVRRSTGEVVMPGPEIEDITDCLTVIDSRLSIATVKSVDRQVDIEPGSSIAFSWVAGILDLAAYVELLERNKKIEAATTDAYKRSLRRSFADRILSDMEGEERTKVLALFGKKKG